MKIEEITLDMIEQKALDNNYDWPQCSAYESGFEAGVAWLKEKLAENGN